MQPLDEASPFITRQQCQSGASDGDAPLEDAFGHLVFRGDMKYSSTAGIIRRQCHDRTSRIIDGGGRRFVMEVLDAVTGGQARLQQSVFSLQLIVAAQRRVRPDESEAKDVTSDAPLGG